MALPPLRGLSTPARRATTAPAGSPGSGRKSDRSSPSMPISPPSSQKPAGQRPGTAASLLTTASQLTTVSPPGTAKMSSYNRTWPSRAQAEVMHMVHSYWAPVEEAVRTRHPGKLEAALREMHGSQYLRTVYSVRRSTGLKATERHAVETELAARLVRARAVSGKWQAGMREISEARNSRDAERLEKMLDKWTFTEDDDDVASAREDLERWRNLATTMPAVLKDAAGKLDVSELRKAVEQLNSNGPNGVEGSCSAKTILSRYDKQVKALDTAIRSKSARSIKEALGAWRFDSEDPRIEAGLSAIQEYEGQKAALCEAVHKMDGPSLQKVLDEWTFERDSPEYVQAKSALERYGHHCTYLSSLAQMPGISNLPELADALNSWEFAADDPILNTARGAISSFEETIRGLLLSGDGWQLERWWGSGRVVKALFGGEGGLFEQALDFLHRYNEAVSMLSDTLRRAEDLNANMAPKILRLIQEWDFAQNDPSVEAARSWMSFHKALHKRNVNALSSATNAGDVFTLRHLLPNARRTTDESCGELHAAEEATKVYDEAVGFIGAMALGVEPSQLQGALERSSRLDNLMQTIRTTVDGIETKWISGLKTMTKPPPIVHAVLQMIVHILAGISPHVRDPPKDTNWRTCQKMMSHAPTFLANLMDVPDSISSGNMAGVGRARAIALGFGVQYEDQWSTRGIAPHSEAAAALFDFLVHVFTYADVIEEAEAGIRSGSRPSSRNAGQDARPNLNLPDFSEVTHQRLSKDSTTGSTLQFGSIDTIQCPSQRTSAMYSCEALSPVVLAANRGSIARASSFCNQPRRYNRNATNPSVAESLVVDSTHPLNFLQRARRSLCRNKVLAVAWVLSGCGTEELDKCIRRMRTYACTMEAAAIVAAQMVAYFLPMAKSLSAGASILSPSAEPSTTLSAHDSHTLTGELNIGEHLFEEASASISTGDGSVRNTYLTVKSLSGDVIANLQIDSTASVVELKRRLSVVEGTPVLQQRLLFKGQELFDTEYLQAVASGSTLTLFRMAQTLPQMVDSAVQSVISTGADMWATTRPGTAGTKAQESCAAATRPSTAASASKGQEFSNASAQERPSDAAAYFVFGPGGEKLSSRPRKEGSLQKEMLKLLRASKDAMHKTCEVPAGSSNHLGEVFNFKLRGVPLCLDHQGVETSQVPLINLALANRALSTGLILPGMDEFVNAMNIFFKDFVPLNAAWTQAAMLCEEAKQALQESEEIAAFASSLEGIHQPRCMGFEGVSSAAAHAMDQVQHLARHGVALPAMFAELIRQAIDDAGAHLLAQPPAAEPGARLIWAEEAMKIQLVPVPHFSAALRGIGHSLSVQEVEEISSSNSVPAAEVVRLIGAVIWAIEPKCKCTPGLVEAKLALADASQFVERLQSWSPVHDASVARITRSRDLLLGIWSWAAAGCSGSKTLCSLFAWVSLVVSFLPIVEMAQHLTPVHKAIKHGIAKAQRAPPSRQKLAKANAWTTALFLLDGPGEQWWWLRLIRPASHMDLPWKDSEDGGVTELHEVEHHEEEAPIIMREPSERDDTQPSSLEAGLLLAGLYSDGEDSGDEYLRLLYPDEELNPQMDDVQSAVPAADQQFDMVATAAEESAVPAEFAQGDEEPVEPQDEQMGDEPGDDQQMHRADSEPSNDA